MNATVSPQGRCLRAARSGSTSGFSSAAFRPSTRFVAPPAFKTRARVMASATQQDGKIGVLFVCLGNICRSPTAEATFRAVVEKAGLADKFDIDSCGTGGGNSGWYQKGGWSYHEGDAADPRMTQAAKRRGVHLTSRSRPLVPLDWTRFQYIIGMDSKNQRDIVKATEYWIANGMADNEIPSSYKSSVTLMTDYCTKAKASEVPDPYYGGPEGFEVVLDLLDDASSGLLSHIRKERSV